MPAARSAGISAASVSRIKARWSDGRCRAFFSRSGRYSSRTSRSPCPVECAPPCAGSIVRHDLRSGKRGAINPYARGSTRRSSITGAKARTCPAGAATVPATKRREIVMCNHCVASIAEKPPDENDHVACVSETCRSSCISCTSIHFVDFWRRHNGNYVVTKGARYRLELVVISSC